MASIERAKLIAAPPPPGSPYSIALVGSEKEGRSAVYRHWRFKDGLLDTLDPHVISYTRSEKIHRQLKLS